MNKDYYNILGVDKKCSEKDIKKAYKKAVLKYHPDRQVGKSDDEKKKAEEKFKDIQEAYECLSDHQKRAHYDRFGSIDGFGSGFSGGMPGGFGGFGGFGAGMPDLSEILKEFEQSPGGFGGRRRNKKEPGQTLRIKIKVSLEDIYKGTKKKYKYPRRVRCSSCNGTGGDGIEPCIYCNGTGEMVETYREGYSIFQNKYMCPHCNGTGNSIKNVCHKCGGLGFIKEETEIEITVPKFALNGSSIKLTGKGHDSKYEDMPSGDLIVQFIYEEEENRAVDQNGNVYEKLLVNYYDCILGTTIKKQLPNGETISVKVKEYTDHEDRITIKGKGIRGGDYIYIVFVKMPKYVTKEEKTLIQKIKKENE